MRFFLDTEFLDLGRTLELVSIGVVAEDGREFYAISREFDPARANAWVRAEVLPRLEPEEPGVWRTVAGIREGLLEFVGPGEPEFWSWGGSAYDWLLVIQLLGGAEALPEGWRYHANELQQWCLMMGLDTDDPRLPKESEVPHHALADARAVKAIWEFLASYQRKWILEQAKLIQSS